MDYSFNQEAAKGVLKSLNGLSCDACHAVLAAVGFALNTYFEKKQLTVQGGDIDEMVSAEAKRHDANFFKQY